MASPWVMRSVQAMEESRRDYGLYRRLVSVAGSFSGTTGSATAGGPTPFLRPARNVTVPSMHADLAGMFLAQCRINNASGQSQEPWMAALEYELGSLDLATGTFTAGVSMPVKRFNDQPAIQTASQLTLLATTTALTATTPTITVTYTNQDGTGGQSAAMVLPTNAALRSAYMLHPLASGDTGLRAVTNMTKSAGTVGIVKCFGYLILAGVGAVESGLEPRRAAVPQWLLETGDVIAPLHPGERSIVWGMMTLVGVGQKA